MHTRQEREEEGLVADLNILGMGSHSQYHMTKKAVEKSVCVYIHGSL
jgi:hypothetical protein